MRRKPARRFGLTRGNGIGRLESSGPATGNLREPYRTLWFAYTCWITQRSQFVCELSGRPGQMRDLAGWKMVLSDEEYIRECRRRGQSRD
jgi:hypothetical protein